ncbi:MAG: 3-dehydroquinate synthase [Rhodocyclaceae bacterium]|nr:3-dehydroquinate synthase [Rhodocyclaceae bacterium]
MQTLHLDLGKHSYPIHIGHGLLDRAHEWIAPLIKTPRVAIVSNETVAPLYLDRLQNALEKSGIGALPIILPEGEQHKTVESWLAIHDALLAARCERGTTLIALGGGVVGDIAGFAAATFQRGIDFIQIPTTLLAQVDSSVGGKTGINHPRGKNMIGAFYQPRMVLIDTDALATLPARELSAGLAEVIKYGLIRNTEFFVWLENHLDALLAGDAAALQYAIGQSCACKAEIVAADERETGERALLNLGHTFGHALEAEFGYGNWLHGEAVAVGTMMAAAASKARGWLNDADCERIARLFERAHLPVRIPPADVERLIDWMRGDKKVASGKLRLVLLEAIGQAAVHPARDDEELQTALTACMDD